MTLAFLVGTVAGGVLAIPLLRAGAKLDASKTARMMMAGSLGGLIVVALFGCVIVLQNYPQAHARLLLGFPLATMVLLTFFVLREKQRDWTQLIHAGAGFFALLVAGSELFLASAAAGLPTAALPGALFYVGGPRSAAALGGSLKNSNDTVREEAVQHLKECGPSAAPVLQAASNDANDQIRSQAISALSRHRSPATTSIMLAALTDRLPSIRDSARYYFYRGYDERVVAPTLTTLMAAESRMEVENTQRMVAELMPAIAAPFAVQMDSEDPKVRQAVMLALSDASEASAVPVLEKGLRDPEATVRALAADALGNVGKEAVHRRAGEVSALKYGGNFASGGNANARPLDLDRVIRALTRALRDPQIEVRLAAAKGLALATTRTFNWNNHVIHLTDREGGMFAPRAMTEAVPDLALLLKHPNPALRRAAARALVNCAGPTSAPAIIPALATADKDVGELLIQALGYTEDPRAVAVLKNLPPERHSSMRCDVCQSFYYLGAYGYVQHGIEMDRDE